MQYIKDILLNIRVMDVIDIAIVAIVLYKLFILIKETRAEQLIKGIVLLLVATKVSEILELYTLFWILEKAMTVGVIAILIVFQPELRRALEYIGRTKFLSKSLVEIESKRIQTTIDALIEALTSLSRQKIGALIIIEKETGLNEVAQTGTEINGRVSSELLINIFIPNTPLHDGAVVIKHDTIKAAACFLPLTDNPNLSKELGTRHRAALGITERSDSLALVVSEETGTISIAEKGNIQRYLDAEALKLMLTETYSLEKQKTKNNIFLKWRNKDEQN